MAQLLAAPDRLIEVSRELIEKIAIPITLVEEKAQPRTHTAKSNLKTDFDSVAYVEDFLRKYHIEHKGKQPWNNGGWIWELKYCWNDPTHTNGDAYITVDTNGKIGAGCHHDSCSGLGWQELKVHFKPTTYDTRDWKSQSYGPTPSSEEAYWNDEPEQPALETVWHRLNENEWGDALLFAEIFRDRIVYDASNKEYYHWNEHYWKIDSTNYVRQLVSGHLGSVYMKAAAEVNVKWAEVEAEISK